MARLKGNIDGSAALALALVLVLLLALTASTSTALQCNMTSDVQNNKERWSQLSGLVFSRDSHAAAAFRNQLWIVGGVSVKYFTKRLEETTTRSDIVRSYDGITWSDVVEEAPFRRRYGHSLFTFVDAADGNERLVLLGGFSPEPANDIWTSLDGINWTETSTAAKWSGRGYHCAVVYEESVFILGGSPLSNDVWSATSLINGDWQQHPNAPWSPRTAHGCAVHSVVTNSTIGDESRRTFIYLMGGYDGSGRNDVWRMNSTGAWEQLLTAAPWKKRAWFSLVSFDSLTPGDTERGPRLWVIGGGIVGKGIDKMLPYTDAWFSRNGTDWIEASSDSSGVSTADWSMVTLREKKVCTGKWGQTVIPFYRNVTLAYRCHYSCMNDKNNTNLANQLIPVCDATTQVPDPPVQKTVMKDNAVFTMKLYPDGCGFCVGTRYLNTTKIPALYLIAGNIGTQKVRDTYVSNNFMLCEKNGEICSNQGTCTPEGICLCNSGLKGPFCDEPMGFAILEDAKCFAPHSTVWMEDGSPRSISQVQIGDKVQAIDTNGHMVASTVYYIPHEDRHQRTRFLRINFKLLRHPTHPDAAQQTGICSSWDIHEQLCFDQMANDSTIEMTPDHLVYVVPDSFNVSIWTESNSSPKAQPYGLRLSSLKQVAAREVMRDTTLVVWNRATEQLVLAHVTSVQATVQIGAVTVYTMSGTVLVNDVLCSNFADLYPVLVDSRRDLLPFAFFSGFRFAFTLAPSQTTSDVLRLFMEGFMVPLLKAVWYPLSDGIAVARALIG